MSEKYKDEETLRQLYWEEEKSLSDIGDMFDRSPATIHRWMSKNDVERRDDASGAAMKRRVERASYHIDSTGYPAWSSWDRNEGNIHVKVHQLLAIAYGADPSDVFSGRGGKVIHHKNEHKIDNRPENIELVTASEHYHMHRTVPTDYQ